MYGTQMGKGILGGLSISKVVGGISKALGLVNQAIPLYNQLRPIISNGKSIMSIINIMNKPDKRVNSSTPSIKNNSIIKPNSNNLPSKKVSNNNLPTFFQ